MLRLAERHTLTVQNGLRKELEKEDTLIQSTENINKQSKLWWGAALLLLLTLISTSVSLLLTANASQVVLAYRRIATMRGPGIPARTGRWAFDISWVDEASQMYFLADASHARVDLFDARTAAYVGSIGGFTGFHGSLDTQGPAGLLTDNLYQLWLGDGN